MGYNYNSTDDYLKIMDDLAELNNKIIEDNLPKLLGYLKSIYRSDLENKYSEPMLWIGMYIALASLVCILAMVADLLHGLRRSKLWFPCKYFKINSAFLSVIAIAMKLPVDLSGSMPGNVDQAGKLGSMAFMCTMMANLLPCLASMDNNELSSNITALCILVITMVVNVCIQIQTGVVSYGEDARILEHIAPKFNEKSLNLIRHRNVIQAAIYVTLLLVLLSIHVCSCLAILKSKNIIESKYKQGHDRSSKDIQRGTLTVDKLKDHVTKQWIMAGSGSPQFIAACFRTTSASGVICLLITISHTLTISWTIKDIIYIDCKSDYSWSMLVILIVQYIGVVIGTIAPLSRCFATLSFKVTSKIILNHFKVFKVESYWTHKLYEWKRASIQFSFGSHKLRVVIDTLKKVTISVCIELQEGVVVVCNITALIPFVLMICVWYCCHWLKWLLKGSLTTDNVEQNNEVSPYVLHLEDELELADRTLKGLTNLVNQLIEKGEENQPEMLIKLIEEKSTGGYLGVGKFDHSDHYVPSLRSKAQYPECWSLPVVTLTAIAVSLQENEVGSLLKSVRDGIEYVRRVEESLNVSDEDHINIRKETKNLWNEIDIYKKWLGHKLKGRFFKEKTGGQIVKWFRDTAKSIDKSNGGRNDNDDNDIRYRSICANSMYHITKTLLLTYHDNIDEVSKQDLFDHLSSMIADIIAACLTNLPQAIIKKCHTSAIEKREASVKDAAKLLGKTQTIMENLRARGTPENMDPHDLPFIDKWRARLGNLPV